MNSRVLALIPARGGSKGVPRKNLHLLAGRPLITYAIADAVACPSIDRVVVSTDDAEIAEVARSAGAEVPFLRPEELALDATQDHPVFEHALRWLKENQSYEPDLVVHLRATCPVREVRVLEAAIKKMEDHPQADSLKSVSWPRATPFKMWKIVDGFLKPLLSWEGVPEPYNQPRQSLPEIFWQNGYVDLTRPRTIFQMRSMTGRAILPLVVEEPMVEIDDEEDFEEAERLLQLKASEKGRLQRPLRRYPG